MNCISWCAGRNSSFNVYIFAIGFDFQLISRNQIFLSFRSIILTSIRFHIVKQKMEKRNETANLQFQVHRENLTSHLVEMICISGTVWDFFSFLTTSVESCVIWHRTSFVSKLENILITKPSKWIESKIQFLTLNNTSWWSN